MAERRCHARRPRHGLFGRPAAAPHVLLRRGRRRRVEDRGRRHLVGAGQRRADGDRLDRLDRRGAVEPQPRVGGHGQRGDPLERDHRPRRLQLDRCRQDVAVQGTERVRPDRRHQGPSLQHQHGVAGGARLALWPERRTRRVQDHRRWDDLEEDAVHQQRDRRARHRGGLGESRHPLRGGLPRLPQRLGHHQRRPRVARAASTSPPTAARPGST